MAGDEAVVADSASTAETATGDAGVAGEQADATHGDATDTAETSTEQADTSEASDDADEDDDASDESAEGLTEEEQKSKAAKRRERRIARENERIEKAVADRLAKAEADRKAADEAAQREAKTSEAVKARAEKMERFVGTPESNAALQAEVDKLAVDLAAVNADPDIDTDPEKIQRSKDLAREHQAKRAELTRRFENSQMAEVIGQDNWSLIESGFASAALFPELAKDPKTQARYLHAQGGIEGALKVLREIVRADVVAEKDAEIAAVKKASADEIKAMTADRNAWRQRAGGSELEGVGAGSPNLSSGVLTPERYRSMPYEERMKLRSTPEGRARIDAMSRNGAA